MSLNNVFSISIKKVYDVGVDKVSIQKTTCYVEVVCFRLITSISWWIFISKKIGKLAVNLNV